MSNSSLPYLFQENTIETTNLVNEAIAQYGTANKIIQIRRGMPAQSLYHFIKHTGLSKMELADILNVSVRTLQRYQLDTMLPSTLTEKLFAVHTLYEQATESLSTSPKETTAWLKSKVAALGNQTPLSYLDTYQGLQEVTNVLGRIAHGVY